LESLPWVAHATVMRLLPNRVRVEIVERTPAAFVRQGSQIGLVDANGVLLGMPGPDADSGTGKAPHYSFPVLTGVSTGDPLQVRAARMKIYQGFMGALDATGEGFSQRVSEVDLSDPEDVRAIVSAGTPGSAPNTASNGAGDVLVHFGEENFLDRYRRYQAHLAEWRAQYPRLAAVDLRYERQAVLEMKPGAAAPPAGAAAPAKDVAVAAPAKLVTAKAAATVAKAAPASVKAAVPVATKAAATNLVVKPAAKSPVVASAAKPATPLTTAFPVTALGAKLGARTPPPIAAQQQGAPR
jgi:cell division protein FtsQ